MRVVAALISCIFISGCFLDSKIYSVALDKKTSDLYSSGEILTLSSSETSVTYDNMSQFRIFGSCNDGVTIKLTKPKAETVACLNSNYEMILDLSNLPDGTVNFEVQGLSTVASVTILKDSMPTCNALLNDASFGGGKGTLANPYRICSAIQLNRIGLDSSTWTSYFKLFSNIHLGDLGATPFNMIGTVGIPFSGTIDGNNKTVYNLSLAGTDGVGFISRASKPSVFDITFDQATIVATIRAGVVIGAVDDLGTFKNVKATNSSVSANFFVGGLLGLKSGTSGQIEQSSFAGTITVGVAGGEIGGIVGRSATLVNSSSSSSTINIGSNFDKFAGGIVGKGFAQSSEFNGTINVVDGGFGIGGIVGIGCGDTIDNNIFSGSINAPNTSKVGGIVGVVDDNYCPNSLSSIAITKSISSGAVTGRTVGGIVGISTSGLLDVSDVASRGTVNIAGTGFGGGIIGGNEAALTISNSYFSGAISGLNRGGVIGSTGTFQFAVFNNTLWDSTINGAIQDSSTVDLTGASGASTSAMQTMATFSTATWSSTIWKLNPTFNGFYPKLSWEP